MSSVEFMGLNHDALSFLLHPSEAVSMLQILAETLRIARLRVKELEAETNIQTTELNRLKEYVNASESAGRTMYGQQVDELKQVSPTSSS